MVWKGVIIEESLEDNGLLKLVQIVKTIKSSLESEKERGILHFHNIEVDDSKKEEFIKKAKISIKQGWYLHICKDKNMVIVFKGKSFDLTKGQKDKFTEAENYGLSIGILEEQLQIEELIDNPWD